MNELAINERMTSLEIAEVTGKQHAHVMRDIRKLLEQGVSETNFGLVEYKDKKGEMRPMYSLTKKGCLILASGYDVLLREKIINRWEELEKKEATHFAVPTSFSEALMLAAKQQEQIEAQQKKIEETNKEVLALTATVSEMQPKVSYVDTILACKETAAITQIAQDYGKTPQALNALLRDLGIQHKVGKQWVLYADYLPYGYVQSETISFAYSDGRPGSRMFTKWTQKGRLFLYEELKRNGVLPLIEQ